MDNFKIVYKILTTLEKAMDLSDFDITEEISNKYLGITKERYSRYIEMLLDAGYIKGVSIKRNINGDLIVEADNARITLKGLEYLQENSIMRQLYDTAKGIKEIVLFI